MKAFYVTFGVGLRAEPHKLDWVSPDGYLTVYATDENEARAAAVVLLGEYSGIYHHVPLRKHFPKGELAYLRVTPPELVVHRDGRVAA